ncbi:TetR family transcriptional regulator [Demequina activiva]|uniref:TetR family transcriptional regulator n=2 Tax=Demequina activiva TaxID=1582364 RepID=A0A919Q399_9MICO|nr:TetR family transcriptional regulator [Demequina activiva]
MAPEERRAMIVSASIPLIREHGAEVTTRQIAQAAGIAEGTVFRAFADKDALIDAAVEAIMDPSEVLAALAEIDPGATLESKVQQVVTLLHQRVLGVVTFMGALGPRDHARHRDSMSHRRPPLSEASGVVADLLEPHRDQLRIPVATAVDYLRVVVFGVSMPFLRAETDTDPVALADVILRGIAAELE